MPQRQDTTGQQASPDSTKTAAQQARSPYAPADTDKHDRDMRMRKEVMDKKRPHLRKCLDPEYAAQNEARKPTFDFEVSCNYDRRNAKGRLESVKESRVIIAQNESDAWAMFCDKIEAWPGPHTCDRTIKKMELVA